MNDKELINHLQKKNAEYIETIQALKTGWISVNDRLPEEDDITNYLVTDGEYYWVGYYRYDAEAWDSFTMGWLGQVYADGTNESANITHWMPLPEPPEEA